VRLDDIALAALQILPTLEWISEQMGHTEIDTTRKHYARWTDATDDRILDALNAERAKETGLKTDSVLRPRNDPQTQKPPFPAAFGNRGAEI
jgi:hypothetical protein